MSSSVQELQRTSEIQGWLSELDHFSQEAAEGSLEAVHELRKTLSPVIEEDGSSEFSLKELGEAVSDETFGTLFAADGIIEGLWNNFGRHNTGYSPESIPAVSEIFQSLGEFIQVGAFNQGGGKGEALVKLGSIVKSFNKLIEETEERAQVEDVSDWKTL